MGASSLPAKVETSDQPLPLDRLGSGRFKKTKQGKTPTKQTTVELCPPLKEGRGFPTNQRDEESAGVRLTGAEERYHFLLERT